MLVVCAVSAMEAHQDNLLRASTLPCLYSTLPSSAISTQFCFRRVWWHIQEAMMTGVAACRPGGCLTEIGSAIHDVADRHGFDTVTR